MTAEDVYRELLEQGDDIGLATVYRVLNQFETAGMVVDDTISRGSQSVYERWTTVATMTIWVR